MAEFDVLVDDFLAHFWHAHPVDASFAGVAGHDHRLPPASPRDAARERRALETFARRLANVQPPDDAAARLDARLMHGYVTSTLAHAPRRARFTLPTWYTGEIAFALIALLLRPPDGESAALAQRIAGIPDWLDEAAAQLAGTGVAADWVKRARREVAAVVRLLERGLPLHPLGARIEASAVAAAVSALLRFDTLVAALPDADPACGSDLLSVLARDVHGFAATPVALEREAAADVARLLDELPAAAAGLTPSLPWREIVEGLAVPDTTGAAAALSRLHAQAMRAAAHLVTPAAEYALHFEPLPAWAREVAAELYFLFYRAPAALAAGNGSVYWVTEPQNASTLKLVHAVHHGSIGHHTQNARARSAGSRLARIAGTDGASGIALLGGGTLVEGWACYAEDLLDEVPGFYTPREKLLLTAFELRNAATALGDLRLHSGVWTLEEMRRFYRDEAAFAPARIWSETTRNSIYPASRVMYWMGTRTIRALRAASPLDARAFHDRLLSYGAAPVAAIARELPGVAPDWAAGVQSAG